MQVIPCSSNSHVVQVKINKKCYHIKKSPQATPECRNRRKTNGDLTIGWRGDLKEAWKIVLSVLGLDVHGKPVQGGHTATAANDTKATAANAILVVDEKPLYTFTPLMFQRAPSSSSAVAKRPREGGENRQFTAGSPSPTQIASPPTPITPTISLPTTPDVQMEMDQFPEDPDEAPVYVVCGTQRATQGGWNCGLNCGGTHVGPTMSKRLYLRCPVMRTLTGQHADVLYCQGTGQIIPHRAMPAWAGCDPEATVQMSKLQLENPYVDPDYHYSTDSDASDHGDERAQPENDAILAGIQPGYPRYFHSGCLEILIAWSSSFKLRYLFCEWNHVKDVAYATRCWEGSRDYIPLYSRGYPA